MWLKRPHNITMGGDVRRIQLNLPGAAERRAALSASPAPPPRRPPTASAVAVTGSDFADFLLGTPDTQFDRLR